MPLTWFGYYAKPSCAASQRGLANVTPSSDKLKQSKCYHKHFASFKYNIPCNCNIYCSRPWSHFKRSLNIDGLVTAIMLGVWCDRMWLWSDPRGFFNLQSVRCTAAERKLLDCKTILSHYTVTPTFTHFTADTGLVQIFISENYSI